jgi:RNA polymerase sigma-70 factor (sigma-E family)
MGDRVQLETRGVPLERGSDGDAVAESGPRASQRGDVTNRESFESFVAARSSALLKTAYLLTQDSHLAEDLLQTALAKTWRAWSRIDTNAEAYVRRVLVNTYASWWRRHWNGEAPTDVLPDVAQGPDDVASKGDLGTALRRLPKRQRAVIVLRYFDDLTEVETARLLGCSVGTVKSQTSKALAKLRVDPGVVDEQGSAHEHNHESEEGR